MQSTLPGDTFRGVACFHCGRPSRRFTHPGWRLPLNINRLRLVIDVLV